MKYILAFDLGTGGIKTSLFDEEGRVVKACFEQCDTYYPVDDFREQNPEDWWEMLIKTTRAVMEESNVSKEDVVAAACSGHSLGVVPIGFDGSLLINRVPIWSDARANGLASSMFEDEEDYNNWYMMTGNGFPAGLYSAFKILWYKQNMPELYENTDKFIGTKDYLNYLLTGLVCTDYSYASGSGVYDLVNNRYDESYIKKFGLDKSKFPELKESCEVIGTIKPDVAELLGLSEKTKIAAGGVDNACMAAGSGCVTDGSGYTSLGTSSWISVSSSAPIVDKATKPYVFGHLIKGMYVSAQSIFSGGNTYRWVRNTICPDFVEEEKSGGADSYTRMNELAETSPIGANGLIFTPTLAGGNLLDKSLDARGTIAGLDLKHTRADIIRAALEGICFGLRYALDALKKKTSLSDRMLIVGGGAKSPFWMQLFANIYEMDIATCSIGENAGSLGAMACAAIGAGLWEDYKPLIKINEPNRIFKSDKAACEEYKKLFEAYKFLSDQQSDLAEYRKKL